MVNQFVGEKYWDWLPKTFETDYDLFLLLKKKNIA